MIYKELLGKTAVITGASTGIGKAIAMRLSVEGMNVIINYFGEKKDADELVKAIEETGKKAVAIYGDVGKEKDVQKILEVAVKNYGSLDLWINNAGYQKQCPSHQMSLEDWEGVLNTNLTGAFLGCREAIKYFLEQNKHGNIINVSSVHERIPRSEFVNYSASKGGLVMLTKSLALEYADKNIRINNIAPGAIETHINANFKEKKVVEAVLDKIPMKEIGTPEDVSNVAAWLASDQSRYVTGTSVFVDGGMSLYPSFGVDKTT